SVLLFVFGRLKPQGRHSQPCGSISRSLLLRRYVHTVGRDYQPQQPRHKTRLRGFCPHPLSPLLGSALNGLQGTPLNGLQGSAGLRPLPPPRDTALPCDTPPPCDPRCGRGGTGKPSLPSPVLGGGEEGVGARKEAIYGEARDVPSS